MENTENETNSSKTAFTQLDADADNGITEIDSVCMNCYKTVSNFNYSKILK